MKVRYSKNYIDKMKIKKQEEKCFSFGINNNFGTDFENAIVTKSCVNLKIKSIKDKNIFTKQNYWIMENIKLFLLPNIIIKSLFLINIIIYHLMEKI